MQDELAAREMYSRLNGAVARASPNQRLDIADYIDSIVKRYPNTPTGMKAKALWTDMMHQGRFN